MLVFEIDGKPVNWVAHGGFGATAFNRKKDLREKYRWLIKAHYNQNTPLLGPIRLSLVFHMPIPKGTSSVRRKEMLSGKMHHLVRPDIDNLTKFICDCLKTIVFEDDSQIFELHAKKIYSEIPKTVIEIS